jgi:hypothetical protein
MTARSIEWIMAFDCKPLLPNGGNQLNNALEANTTATLG